MFIVIDIIIFIIATVITYHFFVIITISIIIIAIIVLSFSAIQKAVVFEFLIFDRITDVECLSSLEITHE